MECAECRVTDNLLSLQFMPAVTIDMHGRFPFVLLRAADRSGMHKLLVRGKAGSTQAQLLQVFYCCAWLGLIKCPKEAVVWPIMAFSLTKLADAHLGLVQSQAAKQEAAQQAYQRQVPTAAVDIIGSGTMTWSRERDRCIDVSDGEL